MTTREKWHTFLVRAVPCLLALAIQFMAFCGTRVFRTADDYLLVYGTSWDAAIPLVPLFVLVYGGAFLQWAIFYIQLAFDEPQLRYRMTTADALGKLICGIIFVAMPLCLIRPAITDGGLLNWLLALVYAIDPPNNILPSLHCFLSYLCTRRYFVKKPHHPWLRWVSLVFTVLVCLSTLFVKQHLIADVVTGVVLAELCYQASAWQPLVNVWTAFCKKVEALVDRAFGGKAQA